MRAGRGVHVRGASPPGINFTAPSTTPTTILSESLTAGINTGGLQVLLVHANGTLFGTAGNNTTTTINPSISVTPPAGGTAASPASVVCGPVDLPAGNVGGTNVLLSPQDFECNAGFVVPTGQNLTITFSFTSSAVGSPSTVGARSLTAWTTPRGNTVSSTTSLS
jgi:hypothetical protein